MKRICFVIQFAALFLLTHVFGYAQTVNWSKEGNSYYRTEGGEIVEYSLPSNEKKVLATKTQLTPAGQDKNLAIRRYYFSNDNKKLLVYTNSKKVWRLDTRGDYWVLDLNTNSIKQLGKKRPASSLMFAKFSPDGNKVAYVSEYNLYVEDLTTGTIK